MADALRSISLRERYTYRARRAVLESFRAWFATLERSNAQKISMQRLSQLIEDEFYEFSDTMNVDDPFFKTVWEECALDPKTLKNALACQLKLNLLDIHERTFRVLDAFAQVIALNPPSYFSAEDEPASRAKAARGGAGNIENLPAVSPLSPATP